MKDEVIQKLSEDEYIPRMLIRYFEKCIDSKRSNSLIKSLNGNVDKTIIAISKMFSMASEFTGETPDSLLAQTGFNLNDMNAERLDAAFAEIRAINFLGLSGFKKIEPIHDKKRKYADLIAYRKQKRVCFEVTCISNAGRKKWKKSDLVNFINFRLNDKGKLKQLLNTKKDYNCNFMNLLIVIVNDAGVALNNRNDYIEILKDVYENNNNVALTFSIVTGKVDFFNGITDDCIYPEVF